MEETFEAYRTRLLSYLGDEEPIAVQQATSSQLDRRLRDVVPEQLIRRPAPENMRQKIRELNVRKRTQIRLEDIDQKLNPILQGWLNHYGRFCPTAMDPMWRYTNATLVAWTMRKYKRYAGRKTRASQLIRSIAIKRPKLFVHWHRSSVGAFA
jgi:hypothetical protein